MADFVSTLLECIEAADLQDELDGGPWPGVHVGDGVHCTNPPTWDKTGPVPQGWSSARQLIRVDDQGQFLFPADRIRDLAGKPAYRARLAPAKRARLDDIVGRLQNLLAAAAARRAAGG